MPLTPLPEDNTKRYKMLYTVEEDNHSLTARCATTMTDATAISNFEDAFAALATFLGTNVSWNDLQVALLGSNVFNPVGGWTPTAGAAAGVVGELDQPRSVCFPGRTTGGRKSKAFIYGVFSTYITPDSYEEDPLTSTEFQAFRGLLNSQSDFWLGIDAIKPSWYNRCTIKANDRWVDGRRG
jgi:hypothetical protein